MHERAISEASAFALDRRNFDYLPDDLAVRWRLAFLKARRRNLRGPRRLIVELLNTCNLDCPMCRVGQHGVDLTRRMPLEVFESLLRQIDTVKAVRLNGLGETTILPDFAAYVDVLAKRGATPELISNGTGELGYYALITDAGGHVLISWDAAEPRTFEQLRRPAKWAEVRARLAGIAAGVAASGRGRCSLIFTLQKANVGQLQGVVELAAELRLASVQVNLAKTPTRHWFSAVLEDVRSDIVAASTVAGTAQIALHLPAEMEGLTVPGGQPVAAHRCTAPWDEVVVRWNGDVQTCNMFNPYTYGNIHRHSFEEIWGNPFADVFRQKLNGEDRHPYCVGCVYMPAAYA
jgi:radical SAM protein with 4Fe4S-binding SPASM domain